jgi:hypothetical protein
MRDSFLYRYGIIGDRTAEGKCPIDMDWMPTGYARPPNGVIRAGRVDSKNLKFKGIVICVFTGVAWAINVPGRALQRIALNAFVAANNIRTH